MPELPQYIKSQLLQRGADLAGVGSLAELPPDVRENLPFGICVAVKYPKAVIRGISDMPTQEYYDWYNRLNEKLDGLVVFGAELLSAQGYRAVAQTREHVGFGETEYNTPLPHKTVATRAGIGWIGKSALLVTEKYGSMVRISSILTDAPLDAAAPINASRCGDCLVCTNACPGGAVSGKVWAVGMRREEFFNPVACRAAARARAAQGFGGEATVCGRCIAVCPYTQRYLEGD
ncbi:MAG: epoxyqueuosine reductase [Oscillospiraceae bacterium]|jgi:epoxyqueuosine reductase QueG|nr:epoxyqueuosine reductase [Oscillospiraceae bacterium]